MNYNTSRDYDRLWTLVQEGKEIVCFTHGLSTYVSIAMKQGKYVAVFSRGVGDIETNSEIDFIQTCKKLNLEFLPPTTWIKIESDKDLPQGENFLFCIADSKRVIEGTRAGEWVYSADSAKSIKAFSHYKRCRNRRGSKFMRYKNNFERLFKFSAPRGFYAEMSRAINVHYVILYKYLRGHAPESTQRANDICTYLTGRTSYNVQPETLWPDKFGIVTDDAKPCINEALVQLNIMDKIESIYGKDSMQIVIAEEYIRGSTYEQIGQKVGRTRERVRQIINHIAIDIKKEVDHE